MFNIKELIHKIYKSKDVRTNNINRNVTKMLVNQGLSVFISFLYVPLFLSFLDDTRYGLWVTILALVNWIGFLDIGMGQGLRNKLTTVLSQKNYALAKIYVSTTYAVVAFIFLFLIAVFGLIYQWFDFSLLLNTPEYLREEIGQVIIIVISLMCISFIVRVFDSIAFAIQKPSITSDINLISHSLMLAIVYLVNRIWGIESLVVFAVIVTTIPIVIKLIYSIIYFNGSLKTIAPSFKHIQLKHSKDLFSLGIVFFIIQIFGVVLAQSNTVILTNVASPDAVPEYYIASKYFSVLLMLFTIMISPIWSAITDAHASNDFDWIRNTLKKLERIFLIFVAIGFVMLLANNIFIPIWTNQRIQVRFIVALLSYLYILVYMLSNIYISVINGTGKIRLQLYMTILVSLMHVSLAVFFGRIHGAPGILAIQLVSYSLILIWAFTQSKLIVQQKDKGIWSC